MEAVVACYCLCYPQGHIPATASASSVTTLVTVGKKSCCTKYIGVLALVGNRRPKGDDTVHLCSSSVSCRGGNSLFWILVLSPTR